ncbi:MAG TPA: hypothetical protein VGK14_05410 [Novimethylophilus sp.]|jgi:cytochrome c556|uniref:hypothetical protein n=1 Tax=Novimethylophilus sp. TaxID=2137426 RepID=UPI002F3F55A5
MRVTIRKLVFGFVLCAAPFFCMAVYAKDGVAVVNEDTRIPVMLRPNEHTRVLNDMRQYLRGLQEMFSALEVDDIAKVAATARALGSINIYNSKLMFPTKSAVRFRELSAHVHVDFESLADDMEKLKDSQDAAIATKDIMGQLSQTMKKCVSCHESYRLTNSPHSGSETMGDIQDQDKAP